RDWNLAFVPKSHTLVTFGSRAMRFWQLPPGEGTGPRDLLEVRSRDGATEGVSTLQFTPDGRQLLVGSDAGVAVWTLPERELVMHFGTRDDYARNVLALAPNGTSLILANHSAGQRWLREGRKWRVDKEDFFRCAWICKSLAFSPDGKHLAVGSRKTGGYAIGGDF